jgi:predicted ATPase/DNA-binding winged helix-turn-helix (wHTH) protein
MTALTTGTERTGKNAVPEDSPKPAFDEVLVFERYQLNIRRRLLLENGQAVRLGSRALAILIVLAQQAGNIVTKRELQNRIWHDIVVEDGTLRVHIAALQRALGESDGGGRYVENIPGHGYRFVAEVTRRTEARTEAPRARAAEQPTPHPIPPEATSIPAIGRIIGRARTIAALAASLPERRLVTLTGPGGGGKTTVAVGVAETSLSHYPQGIFFVDLAPVAEPRMVPGALAAALGIATVSNDPMPPILSFLRQRNALLVLDNCEHVVEAVAQLATSVLIGAPRVHILATSREPLGVAREWVHRLAPLETPPLEPTSSNEQILSYPAIQLFVERARASCEIEFDAAALLLVADLCRRLGGNPLAIEITAARVDLLGLHGLAASLEQGLHLSIGGSRVAVDRHRTLRKTLDWSYELLAPEEQVTFRRLAVFSGSFGLESAAAVASDNKAYSSDVFESLLHLASKSLVVADATGEKILYRLLEIPRAYALEKLRASGEFEATRTRHIQMWCTIGAAEMYAQTRRGTDWAPIFNRSLDDLRSAIHWSFSSRAPIPLDCRMRLFCLWFEFVLAAECAGWQDWKRIATSLNMAGYESAGRLARVLDEMPQHFKGSIPALTGAAPADTGATGTHRTALWSLWIELLVKRDFRIAINISAAFRDRTEPSHESAPMLDGLLAVAHHYAGRQSLARHYAERAVSNISSQGEPGAAELPQLCHMRTILARSLWLLGLPDSAMAAARRSIVEAQLCGNAHLLGLSLIVNVILAAGSGFAGESNGLLNSLREHAAAQGLEYFQLWIGCLEAIIARRAGQGEPEELSMLSPDPLESSQYVDVLAAVDEQLVSPDTIIRTQQGRGGWVAAEVLRVKAQRLLRAQGAAAFDDAEAILLRALEIAREQGALAWELKVAMSLARLWSMRQNNEKAREILSGVYARYTEGIHTTNLLKAAELLQSLKTG